MDRAEMVAWVRGQARRERERSHTGSVGLESPLEKERSEKLCAIADELERLGHLEDEGNAMREGDGTGRLCVLLYGENTIRQVRKLVGGANAQMLHDAADELERLGRIEAEHQGCTEQLAEARRFHSVNASQAVCASCSELRKKADDWRFAFARAERQRDAAHRALDELREQLEASVNAPSVISRENLCRVDGLRRTLAKLDALDPRKQEQP